MRKIIVLVILVALGWKGYERYDKNLKQVEKTPERLFDAEDKVEIPLEVDLKPSGQSGFACDGRTYCSQMKSCKEAEYFLAHCPNVKMDGNNDGIPCERQWCN
jgi:hypothetical protein